MYRNQMLKAIILLIFAQCLQCDIVNITPMSVIVWEKCGLEAKTQVTKIMEGSSIFEDVEIFFNPLLNALKFKTKQNSTSTASILMLPEHINVLIFTFENNGLLNVLTDCHQHQNIKLQWPSNVHLASLTYEINDYAMVFPSVNDAKKFLMCEKSVSISVGALLNFPSSQLLSAQLFTLIDGRKSYFFSYKNFTLTIHGPENQIDVLEFKTARKNFGLYIIIRNDHLEFYTKCPYGIKPELTWNATKFQSVLQFQSKRTYYIGSALTSEHIKVFCMKNKYVEIYENSSTICHPALEVKTDFVKIQSSNNLFYYFLPTFEQMERIKLFTNLNLFNKESRIASFQPKITFASRSYAPQKFFARPLIDYVNGFTDGYLNFWIGLDALHKATTQTKFGLRIEVEYGGYLYFEEYREVQIGNSTQNYNIKLGGPKPHRNHFLGQNNQPFSALDFNQKTLAQKYSGGFWFLPTVLPNFPTNTFYCFTCEHGNSPSGTSTYYYQEGFFTFVTRMQLLL